MLAPGGDLHPALAGNTRAVLAGLADLLGFGPCPPGDFEPAPTECEELGERELEVLDLVAEGLSDVEIAEWLVLSQHTVHRRMANIRANSTSRRAA